MLPEAICEREDDVDVVEHGQVDQEAVEHGVHRAGQQDGDGQGIAQNADLKKMGKRRSKPQTYHSIM